MSEIEKKCKDNGSDLLSKDNTLGDLTSYLRITKDFLLSPKYRSN